MIPRRLLFLIPLLAAAGAARAQVLADRLPADAVAYAGWAGSDALGPAYDNSHFKEFLNALNLPALASQHAQAVISRLNNSQNTENTALLRDLLASLAKSPTALYAGPVDFSNPAQPVPKIALISKIGAAQADRLADPLSALLGALRPPNGPPSGAIAVDDFLLIYIGDAKFPERLSGPAPGRNLAADDNFKKSLAQIGPGAAQSAAVIYLDGAALVQEITTAIQVGNNSRARELFPAIADGIGLSALQQFAWAGNFDGADWTSSTFIGMRDRRNGLLALLDNKPLSEESLRLIPRSATSAGSFRFDGMRFLGDLSAAAAKVSDQAPKQMDTLLTQAYVVTGIDVKRQLLPAFGDEFVYYVSPGATGNSLRGFTCFNRLKDAKKADSAVSAIENFINLLIAQRDPNTKLQFQTQKLPAPWDAVTAHVIALPQASPCWAISGDVFYFSLSLPGLQSALEMSAANKPSLLDNPQFVGLRTRLGRQPFASFSFDDFPASAPETYQLAHRILTGILAQNPAAGLSAFDLPPLEKITPALAPGLSISWSDTEGYHAKTISPFPGSSALSPASDLWVILAEQIRQARQAPSPATPPDANRP